MKNVAFAAQADETKCTGKIENLLKYPRILIRTYNAGPFSI